MFFQGENIKSERNLSSFSFLFFKIGRGWRLTLITQREEKKNLVPSCLVRLAGGNDDDEEEEKETLGDYIHQLSVVKVEHGRQKPQRKEERNKRATQLGSSHTDLPLHLWSSHPKPRLALILSTFFQLFFSSSLMLFRLRFEMSHDTFFSVWRTTIIHIRWTTVCNLSGSQLEKYYVLVKKQVVN